MTGRTAEFGTLVVVENRDSIGLFRRSLSNSHPAPQRRRDCQEYDKGVATRFFILLGCFVPPISCSAFVNVSVSPTVFIIIVRASFAAMLAHRRARTIAMLSREFSLRLPIQLLLLPLVILVVICLFELGLLMLLVQIFKF